MRLLSDGRGILRHGLKAAAQNDMLRQTLLLSRTAGLGFLGICLLLVFSVFVCATTSAAPASSAPAAPSAATTAPSTPGGSAASVLAEFAKKRESIKTVQARFTQENVTRDETYHSKGTLVYVKPRRIVYRYDDPVQAYLIDEKKVYKYDAKTKQLEIFALGNEPEAEALFVGFDSDVRRLESVYDVERFAPGDEAGASQGVLLRPKKPAVKAGDNPQDADMRLFERVRLYLRAEDSLPLRIHIINDADSETSIRLADYKINETLDPKLTQIEAPEGTKVVNEEAVSRIVGPGGELFPPASSAPAKPPVTPPAAPIVHSEPLPEAPNKGPGKP